VQDNALYGYTGPIMGTRMRLQVEPAIGGLRWMSYLVDARRYEPVVFNFITIAARAYARIGVGRDEEVLPSYIGSPDKLRGYSRGTYNPSCQFTDISNPSCEATRLIGSRVALASAELRFPLVRSFQIGILPLSLPPVDGLVFFDAGMAWNSGDQTAFLDRVPEEQQSFTRFPLRSYGYGLRLNLYNLALLRWDYSIPLDLGRRKGFWTFSIGPSF
jgi:outer membrane protein assembly factor BamA